VTSLIIQIEGWVICSLEGFCFFVEREGMYDLNLNAEDLGFM
jgi:hypothetical protein